MNFYNEKNLQYKFKQSQIRRITNMNPLTTINSHQIRHLRQFYSPSNNLFQEATNLPQFFLTNLVDDSRIVKYFHNDPQANIRIFYYQYLKLCFQIDNVDYQSYIEKIYELIRTQGFEFYFDQNDKQKQFKNAQFKSLLIDFFEIMNSSSMTIETVLSQYPILDQVFTNFFRTVVMIASIASEYNSYIDKNSLFDFLSSFFSVDISSYDKCLKFVQSDIFVYEQNPENIYMAFIKDDQEEVQQSYQTISSDNNVQMRNTHNFENKLSYENQNQTEQNQASQIGIRIIEDNKDIKEPNGFVAEKFDNTLKPRAKTIIKQSYIQGQFADYTSFNNISALGKKIPQDFQKQVSQTLQNNTYSHQNQSYQANEKDIAKQQKVISKEQQLKRVLSQDNHIKFEINSDQNVSSNQNKLYEKINSFTKGSSQPNLLSAQNNQNLVESFYQQGQSGINIESKQQLENEDLSNSKQSKPSKTLNRNLLYQIYQQPTKDPGFGNNQNINVKPVESTIYHQNNQMKVSYESNSFIQPQQNKYKDQILNIYSNKKSDVNVNKYDLHKQNTSTEPLFHKPLIPIPTLLSQNSLSANSRNVISSKPSKQPFQVNNFNSIHPLPRQNLKLNVTKEFTNSIVMKSMNEPYKSSVHQMRQRAREFRKNIYQEFNYQSSSQLVSQYNLKKPSSRTNLPSQQTLENIPSSNQLETDYYIKPQLYTNTNSIIKTLQKFDDKQFNLAYLKKQQKLSQIKQSIPSANSIKQSNSTKTISPFNKQNTLFTNQTNSNFPPMISTISLGPSIIVTKNSSNLNEVKQKNNYQEQNNYQTVNQNSQQLQYQNSYRLQNPNPNPYQINQIPGVQKSQNNQYSSIQKNNLSSPINNNYQKHSGYGSQYQVQHQQINRNQIQGQNYIKGQNIQVINNVNTQNMMHPQNVKKQLPVYIPYERRK